MEKRNKRKIVKIPIDEWDRMIAPVNQLPDQYRVRVLRYLLNLVRTDCFCGDDYIVSDCKEHGEILYKMYSHFRESEGLPPPELGEEKEVLVSILGDSISTYEGYSNDAETSISTACNPVYYSDQLPPEETYWGRLLEAFEFSLCVNNSWSGGLLTGENNPTSGVERAKYLANDRGEKPDIIILFMGINDLGWGVSPEEFRIGYRKTLLTFKELYPNASVICVNMPNRKPYAEIATKEYNKVISDCVEEAGKGFSVADLYNAYEECGDGEEKDSYNNQTLDGLHPDANGMEYIYFAILDACLFTDYDDLD